MESISVIKTYHKRGIIHVLWSFKATYIISMGIAGNYEDKKGLQYNLQVTHAKN